MGTKEQESEDTWASLGYLRDGVQASGPLVKAGFGIAHASIDAGFAIGRAASAVPFQLGGLAMNGEADGGAAQAAVQGLVDAIHAVTRTSVTASEEITKMSLYASDSALDLAGVQAGQTEKALVEYIESQAGQDGYEVKEALFGLAKLLVQVGGDQKVANPLKLMSGAQTMAKLHAQHREERRRERAIAPIEIDQPTPSKQELQHLARYMRFAAAAYGILAVQFLGIIPDGKSRMQIVDDASCIETLVGIPARDVLVHVQQGELYRPGHFVAIDRANREVVVAIRGTMRAQDVLVDLVCESAELFSATSEDGQQVVAGKAHRGFLKSAQRLANDLHQVVAEALRNHPDYELKICGHSLGGGVASLLGLLWARIPEFRARNLQAYSYAAPCCVCNTLSQSPFARKYVTSVVTGDDMVSRFGLATFKELQRSLVTLAPLADVSLQEKAQAYQSLPRPDLSEKLFCAGTVWWLESKEYEPLPIVKIDPVKELSKIELFADIFAVHLPSQYVNSLESLAAGKGPPKK